MLGGNLGSLLYGDVTVMKNSKYLKADFLISSNLVQSSERAECRDCFMVKSTYL